MLNQVWEDKSDLRSWETSLKFFFQSKKWIRKVEYIIGRENGNPNFALLFSEFSLCDSEDVFYFFCKTKETWSASCPWVFAPALSEAQVHFSRMFCCLYQATCSDIFCFSLFKFGIFFLFFSSLSLMSPFVNQGKALDINLWEVIFYLSFIVHESWAAAGTVFLVSVTCVARTIYKTNWEARCFYNIRCFQVALYRLCFMESMVCSFTDLWMQ